MHRCTRSGSGIYVYVSPNGFTLELIIFIVMATLGQRVLECSIIDNLLFSDRVPLKIRLDLNVDHMLERNCCQRLVGHEASTERIEQFWSDLECKLSMLLYGIGALQCKNVTCKKYVNELS